MSDTNSWNYQGNTGALAVKSKYLQPDSAPLQDDPVTVDSDTVLSTGSGGSGGGSGSGDPQPAPVDTNS